jgi:hypothetical protein
MHYRHQDDKEDTGFEEGRAGAIAHPGFLVCWLFND